MKTPPRAIAGAAVLALAAAGALVARGLRNPMAQVDYLLVATEASGPQGWLVFTAIQVGVAALGILPASLLAIAAGLSYGLWLGFALSATGTLLGGWLAFLLSRSILRPWITQLLMSRERLAKFDAAVARDGWRFVCLMRVSPLMPFAATSYGLGLTGIDNRQFLLGTLASLPALLGYVATGAFARTGLAMAQNDAGLLKMTMLALGVAATVFAGFRVQRMLRASLGADTLVHA
ncbi:MAG TPA: VTT domain-containing protein [Sphingomicrobium sp.]